MRIVSLLASGTEIVCALGAGPLLVGRSHECDNPPWVRELPACSEPAFDVSLSSSAIDAEVKRRLGANEPLYRIHFERILDLAPDLLITQSHCEVCAITPADVASAPRPISPAQVTLNACSLSDIFDSIRQVGTVIGRPDAAGAVIQAQRRRLDAIRSRTAGLKRPSVMMIEWTSPVFLMANWGPELVEAANGDLIGGQSGQHSVSTPFDTLLAADPEFIIVAPCGFSLERSIQEQATLEACPGWSALRAVRNGNVAFADGNLYFNRSGMTVTRTAEIIAEILHGLEFAESARGAHWRWITEDSVLRSRKNELC